MGLCASRLNERNFFHRHSVVRTSRCRSILGLPARCRGIRTTVFNPRKRWPKRLSRQPMMERIRQLHFVEPKQVCPGCNKRSPWFHRVFPSRRRQLLRRTPGVPIRQTQRWHLEMRIAFHRLDCPLRMCPCRQRRRRRPYFLPHHLQRRRLRGKCQGLRISPFRSRHFLEHPSRMQRREVRRVEL